MIGIVLYTKSPVVKYFWSDASTAPVPLDISFYGVIHILLMFTAIVLLTVGSALAKRKPNDSDKFRTIVIWYTLVLIIIFIAIPWPFSPLSARPYLRTI
jgi:prolipoprotein diacylglyceryltransferase